LLAHPIIDSLSYHSVCPPCITSILSNKHSLTCILDVYKDVDLVGWKTNQINSGCGSNPIHA